MKKTVLFMVLVVMVLSGCKSLEVASRRGRNDCLVWSPHEFGIVCPEDPDWKDVLHQIYTRNLEACAKAYSRVATMYPSGQAWVVCQLPAHGANENSREFRIVPEWGMMPEWKELFEKGSTVTRTTWKAKGWE